MQDQLLMNSTRNITKMFNAELVIQELEAIRKQCKTLDAKAEKVIRMMGQQKQVRKSYRQRVSESNATYLDNKFS
jgi:tetrahydromethanopterin S-methyltransferase subunit B